MSIDELEAEALKLDPKELWSVAPPTRCFARVALHRCRGRGPHPGCHESSASSGLLGRTQV